MKTPNSSDKTGAKVPESKIVLYTDKRGNVELRADIEKDTLWATQDQIARLFNVSRPNVTMHLKNIFKTGELNENSVSKDSLLTGRDSKQYLTKFYNLDAIIAVGYRINSKRATKFRMWATKVLRDYLVQGYAINQYQLPKSSEALDGLREAIALIESKEHKGVLKGKLTLKLTKNLIP
ncbi:MAG: RhuM family protein [Patescibacteria group bacterium]